MRADQLLLQRGLLASRAAAQRAVTAGQVFWLQNGNPVKVPKPSTDLPEDAELELTEIERYVSRGGIKLEGALKATGLDVSGKSCLDVGQSTGGFTDCLLQHGAARVVGVDVGHSQLHARLRGDARVLCLQKINARELVADDLPADALPLDIIVGDLSFISQTLVLPALAPLLADDGALLMLVKPQFELQPAQIGKGGIVRDARHYAEVEQRIRGCCEELGLQVLQWLDSPIVGGDGNREFFVHAVRASPMGKP